MPEMKKEHAFTHALPAFLSQEVGTMMPFAAERSSSVFGNIFVLVCGDLA